MAVRTAFVFIAAVCFPTALCGLTAAAMHLRCYHRMSRAWPKLKTGLRPGLRLNLLLRGAAMLGGVSGPRPYARSRPGGGPSARPTSLRTGGGPPRVGGG